MYTQQPVLKTSQQLSTTPPSPKPLFLPQSQTSQRVDQITPQQSSIQSFDNSQKFLMQEQARCFVTNAPTTQHVLATHTNLSPTSVCGPPVSAHEPNRPVPILVDEFDDETLASIDLDDIVQQHQNFSQQHSEQISRHDPPPGISRSSSELGSPSQAILPADVALVL